MKRMVSEAERNQKIELATSNKIAKRTRRKQFKEKGI